MMYVKQNRIVVAGMATESVSMAPVDGLKLIGYTVPLFKLYAAKFILPMPRVVRYALAIDKN